MRRRIRRLLAPALAATTLIAAAAAPSLRAQDTTRPAAASTAAAAAPAPRAATPASLRAAEELLHLMNVEELLRSSTEAAFDAQTKAQPLMAPFRGTMQAWVDKYLTWAEFGPKLTQVYAEEFSEPELRELIAFYQTPIGRKTAALSPELSRRGAQVGAEVAEAHMAELQQMIQARAAELQQQQGKTPPAAAGDAKQPTPAPKKP